MNLKVTKRWTLQTIWWKRKPDFKVWVWPRVGSNAHDECGPLFYGLYLGVVEWRWFDNKWGNHAR